MEKTALNLENHLPVGYSANAFSIRTQSGANETLTHVVIGTDFIAGSSVNLRNWVVIPTAAICLAQPITVASRSLPPVRQLRFRIGEYLDELNLKRCRVWRQGTDEPLPMRPAVRVGIWLVLQDADTETADFLIPITSLNRLELSAVDNSLVGLGFSGNLARSKS